MFDLTLGSDPGSLLSNLRRRIFSSSPQPNWSTSHFLFLAQLLVLCFDHQVHLDVHLMPLIRQPATFFTSPSLPSPSALPTRSTWISILLSSPWSIVHLSSPHLHPHCPPHPIMAYINSNLCVHSASSKLHHLTAGWTHINLWFQKLASSYYFTIISMTKLNWLCTVAHSLNVKLLMWCDRKWSSVKKVAVAEEIVAWKITVDDLWRHRKPPLLTVLHNLLQNGLTSFERGRASWKLW